jgi:lauroyl/myristoyl acyltransferase
LKEQVVSGLRRAPLPVAAPFVRRRVRRALADPVALEVAHRQMDFLLGVRRPDVDLDAVAMRHVEQVVWRRELRWRTDFMTSQRVTGAEHLVDGREGGKGLILCFLHHGRFEGIFGSLARAGGPHISAVGHPSLFDPAMPAHTAAHRRLVEKGSTLVPASLGYEGLRDLVANGDVLGIALDLPGSTRARFVGRDVRCASGAARIACDTGAAVVLALPRRIDDLQQDLVVSEPLSPADHQDPLSLLQAILDGFEESVLDWPEAYDWPKQKFVILDDEGNPVPHVREPGEPPGR